MYIILKDLHGYIQGDSGERVNVLRSASIGHCEEKKKAWSPREKERGRERERERSV
jgi:hypothetical protein